VGPDGQALQDVAENAGAHVLRLAQQTADMRSTCEHGLAWLQAQFRPEPDDGWLLVPADHPTLHADVVRALLAAAEQDPAASVIVPTHRGKHGHPVWVR